MESNVYKIYFFTLYLNNSCMFKTFMRLFKVKRPKIFISHSSKDKFCVDALIELLNGIGVYGGDKIFCSSEKDLGIPLGGDIFYHLREQFENYKLFVIFVQSKNFLDSPVSLNEMGATWISKIRFCSIISPTLDFNEMKGVIDHRIIGIKLGNSDAGDRLDQFKQVIMKLFKLKDIGDFEWTVLKSNFLKVAENIELWNLAEEYEKDLIIPTHAPKNPIPGKKYLWYSPTGAFAELPNE